MAIIHRSIQGHGATLATDQHEISRALGRAVVDAAPHMSTSDGISEAIRLAGGTGPLAKAITGMPASSKEYKAVQRNLQRWQLGRTPKLATVEAYAARAAVNTGEENPALLAIMDAVKGNLPVLPGYVAVRVTGTITILATQPDTRDRSVKIDVPDDTGYTTSELVLNPLGAWIIAMERICGYSVRVDALDVLAEWYTPESEAGSGDPFDVDDEGDEVA